MDIAEDLALLHREGIDEHELIQEAARFLRAHPRHRPAASPPLSAREVELLRDSGAVGLERERPGAAVEAIPVGLAVEYRRLVADALSKEEVSERLGVVDSRIRQRVRERSIYVVTEPDGRRFPRFQFDDEGTGTLPGLRRVLTAIDQTVHPVVVADFFVTPTVDLECEIDGRARPLSPREWLMAGLPVEEVVLLAREL